MFVYHLSEPIDFFDHLTPLPDWIANENPERTAWVLQAILALADAAPHVGWNGDMRHLPMINIQAPPDHTTAHLIIKQDNNGDTFLITATPIADTDEYDLIAEVPTRIIGPWTPDDNDALDTPTISTLPSDFTF